MEHAEVSRHRMKSMKIAGPMNEISCSRPRSVKFGSQHFMELRPLNRQSHEFLGFDRVSECQIFEQPDLLKDHIQGRRNWHLARCDHALVDHERLPAKDDALVRFRWGHLNSLQDYDGGTSDQPR